MSNKRKKIWGNPKDATPSMRANDNGYEKE